MNAEYMYQDENGERLNVYPDTLGFTKDSEDYDLFSRLYFWHPRWDDYPVVNISTIQAQAYCQWRAKQLNKEFGQNGILVTVSLPSISQYEFALKHEREVHWKTNDAPNDEFSVYPRKDFDWGFSFLTEIDHQSYKIKRKDEGRLRKILFNERLADNRTQPFHFLNGNVSELVSDPVSQSALKYYALESNYDPHNLSYAIGGNYGLGVKTRSDCQFNALFYKSLLRKRDDSPYIGFRLVYKVELIDNPDTN
ncbi:MAG: sulfatase activating formylglycine-generating enzyme [Flavobacteriaceae bacterium]|jgi:formylglycine-generating enzyme required for sulfatase activity